MEVLIQRTYYPNGSNGVLSIDGETVCKTIELPWQNNARQISCIPEGRYRLLKRTSAKYGPHLLVSNVPNRALILIHPANDAKTELRGCIAPVTILNGPGKGSKSRLAFEMVRDTVYEAIDKHEDVFLTITGEPQSEQAAKNTI
jgi:hypothetical protein